MYCEYNPKSTIKWKTEQKIPHFETVPKSNRKIIERKQFDIPNTQISKGLEIWKQRKSDYLQPIHYILLGHTIIKIGHWKQYN